MRVLLRQLVILVISVVLDLIFAGLALLVQGMPVDRAFLVEGPNLIFVFMDIGLVIWMVLLIIGGIRRQGLGAGRAGTIIAAVVAALGNLVVITVLVVQSGSTDLIAIGIGALAGAVFVAGAALATVVAHRLLPLPAVTEADSSGDDPPPASAAPQAGSALSDDSE
jgi:hypothetical protein